MTDEIPPISPPIKERPPAVDGPPTSAQFDYLLEMTEGLISIIERNATALELLAKVQAESTSGGG